MDLLAWGWYALKTVLKQSWHESLSLWGMHSDMYTDQPSVLERNLCWWTSFGVRCSEGMWCLSLCSDLELSLLKVVLENSIWDPQEQTPLEEVPLLHWETWQVLYIRDHASMCCCREQKAGAKMGGRERVQGLEACCSTIRCFRSLKSCAWTCFLDLQRGRLLSEREVGEKCSEKRNPQPALICYENIKECGDIIGKPILSTYMTTEITNVARFSSWTLKGVCGAVKREESLSCGRVSLSLNKTGRQPGGRQLTKQEVQMRTEGRMRWIKSTSVGTICVCGEWCRCDFSRKIPWMTQKPLWADL